MLSGFAMVVPWSEGESGVVLVRVMGDSVVRAGKMFVRCELTGELGTVQEPGIGPC